MEALLSSEDLAGLPGGPFTQAAVNAAAEQVRTLCGWHIAPEITETIRLDSDGAATVLLPSMRVASVESVRDADTGEELAEWRWSPHGMIHRPGGFPEGFQRIEVTFTHGFPKAPADLLPVIADRTERRVMQESLGSRSVSYSAEGDRTIDSGLTRYKLRPRP